MKPLPSRLLEVSEEHHLAGEEVPVVEGAASQGAAADEALGEPIGLGARPENELGRVGLHIVVSERRGRATERGIDTCSNRC